MKTITILFSIFMASFCIATGNAQVKFNINKQFELKVEKLEAQKEEVKKLEKEKLKKEVEAINNQLSEGDISEVKAAELKKAAAEKRALNIENQLTIIDQNIELLQRNKEEIAEDSDNYYTSMEYMEFEETKVYDSVPKRTTSGPILAFGLNNTIIDGQSLDDSPYKIGGSRFFELGYEFETVLTESGLQDFATDFPFSSMV
ncbi:hypothetical protein ACFSO9_15340 [Mesonia maritima]|uniref:hypothetical protein n=1 Tax=Mesonia maritima TaxID=1793873 RepID=UPI00364161DA